MRVLSRAFAALVAVGVSAAGLTALSALPASATPGDVVISQVYGGGGNTGAPYTHDFVELFNRSSAPVSLNGWSVQYASATGSGHFAANTVAISGSLAAGQRYLVRMGGGSTGSELPTPDATASILMGAGGGKVALVKSDTGLACNGAPVACTPEQLAQVADLVGYGNATFGEGSAAPTPSATLAALRKSGGCLDTDANNADFETGAPAPRNTASAATPCGGSSPSPSPSTSPTTSPSPSPSPTADPCEAPATHQIAQVQGSGDASPLAGQNVRVEGVVTGDFQKSTQLSGFYLQDPTPDNDPKTSEGLFVFARDTFKDVKVGDRVLVSGKAIEFNGLTELSPVTSVGVCGTGTVAAQPYELPRPAGVTFEPVENMLLTFPETLTVSEHYNVGRFGEVLLSSEGRLYHQNDRPGVTVEANLARSLLLDDGSGDSDPQTVPYSVRNGDTVKGLTGVLGYSFNLYRLQPVKPVDFAATNPRPAQPAKVGGNVTVASINTLNWFTTLGSRGARTPEEQKRQLTKLVAALKGLDADVVGLMEVENNGQVALQALVDAVNAEVGAGTYAALKHPFPGTDVIQVGAIYKPAKVKPVGETLSSEDPVNNRPPLIQTFRRVSGGQPFTIAVNHLKSKQSCPASGPDTDQGQGCWNPTRVRQAEALVKLLDTLDVPHPIILGDINAYSEEDPIHTLESASYTSLTKKFVPLADRYSYVFEGRSGELDHALVGKQLLKRVTGATIWHINADEPRILAPYGTGHRPDLYQANAFRSSDHDPVLIGLDMPGGK
ncbi:ExeM/NucH family extracellular endonuclease [Nonomuraea sp. NPDC050310]|uniref:ExeM/NucH family extracellular endonuclease n=1 Tax=unclassified Nonomuraea TaxID=2593643 RepID=UPI0034024F53